jgi:hypothetical protein
MSRVTSEQYPEVFIGDPVGDHLAIRALGRLHPRADDYWDGNWLQTAIVFSVGAFRGMVGASLRTDELRQFRVALEKAYKSLEGEAVLDSMEEWLQVKLVLDRAGHVRITGVLADRVGDIGNRLNFRIEGIDQSYLPSTIDALGYLEERFPVLGSP